MNNCDRLVINSQCTDFKKSGRGNVPYPVAIVLQSLPMGSQMYLGLQNGGTSPGSTTSYPKSVHYLITEEGSIIELVSPVDSAVGLDKLSNPTWPLTVSQITGDVNDPFIYIGISGSVPTTFQQQVLSSLVCCLSVDYNIPVDPLHIITALVLDDTRDVLEFVPPNVIPLASACRANGGLSPLPNIIECCAQVDTLSNDIAGIQAQIALLLPLLAQFAQLTSLVQSLQQQLDALIIRFNQTISDLPALRDEVSSLISMVGSHQDCIDKLCGCKENVTPIHYQVTSPANYQTITPNVNVIVNAKEKVSDTDPLSVITGPLWTATLSIERTWTIEVLARFEISDWCINKQAWLNVTINGVTSRLVTWTASQNGTLIAQMSGVYVLAVPPQANIQFSVGTNDVTTPNKVLTYFDVRMS